MQKAPSKTSKPTSKSNQVTSPKDYERFGRYMADVYESGYINRKRMYYASFVKGILLGFGGVVGATVVVGLLLWGLSLFSEVPFIGDIAKNLESTINTSTGSN